MRFDGETTHHIDIGAQAIPAIWVQQLNRRAAHDVNPRVDQHQGRRRCRLRIRRVFANAEHLHRRRQRLVSRVLTKRVLAPGFQASSDGAVNFLSLHGCGDHGGGGDEKGDERFARIHMGLVILKTLSVI